MQPDNEPETELRIEVDPEPPPFTPGGFGDFDESEPVEPTSTDPEPDAAERGRCPVEPEPSIQ